MERTATRIAAVSSVVVAVVVVVVVGVGGACDIAPLHPIDVPLAIDAPLPVDELAPDFGSTVEGQVGFVLKDDGTISAVDVAGDVLATFAAPDGAVSIAHDDGHHLYALTPDAIVMIVDRDGFEIARMPLPDWATEPIEHVAVVGGRIAVGGGQSVMFLDAPGAIVHVDEPIVELFAINGRVAYMAAGMRDLESEHRAEQGLPPDQQVSPDETFIEQIHIVDDGGVDRATTSMIAWAPDVPGAGFEGAAGSDDALMWSVERYQNDGAYWVDLDVVSLPDMFIDVDDHGFTDYDGVVSLVSLPRDWVPLDVTATPRPHQQR